MPASGDAHSDRAGRGIVRLEPWGADDFPLLEQQNAPEMTAHLGGPESPEALLARQAKYEGLAETSNDRMYKIVLVATGTAVGSVGYWERTWHGEEVYETGWGLLPAFQGRGLAAMGTAQAIELARASRLHRYLHAFPSVENLPSNALCRRLGFTLVEEFEGEYPKGHFMRCNDWRLDLFAGE
jgi:RimJ/RimL family protein N-acetyltransferase